MTDTPGLRALIEQATSPILLPGAPNALTARVIEQAGFGAVYVSGAGVTNTYLGMPDLGLMSVTELVGHVAAMAESVSIPLVVDADTGFGNALNVRRTVQLLERAGASAIQLEDQTLPKRCGHLDGKTIVPAAEMAGKIRAAVDARRNAETLIIARTDAVAVEGLEPALERAERYAEAGADVLFVEALRTKDDMAAALARLSHRAPMLANMVEGGKTPVLPSAELQSLGYSIAIFPGGTVRALSFALQGYLQSLREHGTTTPWLPQMLSFDKLNDVIGTPEMLALGKRYE